jgi:hypothetical protein
VASGVGDLGAGPDAWASPRAEVAKAPAIRLTDQFGQAWRLEFPRAQPSLLTVADQRGSDQVLSWVRSVRESYSQQLDIYGIAQLGPVPKVFRGRIERGFCQAYRQPILLDWGGELARNLGCVKDQANIFLLDRDGTILNRWRGVATETSLAELAAAVQRVLNLSPAVTGTGAAGTNAVVLPAEHRVSPSTRKFANGLLAQD